MASSILVGCSRTTLIDDDRLKHIEKYMVREQTIKKYASDLALELSKLYKPNSNLDYYDAVDAILNKMNGTTANLFNRHVNTNYNYDFDSNKNRKISIIKSEVGISSWNNYTGNRVLVQLEINDSKDKQIVTFEFILSESGDIVNYEIY